MNAFEFFARCVVNQNVEHCFALLGDANMQVAATMADLGVSLHLRATRTLRRRGVHGIRQKNRESRSIDRNLRSGAHADNDSAPGRRPARIPMVIFAGESPLGKSWYNQQIEQRPFVEATGAIYPASHM